MLHWFSLILCTFFTLFFFFIPFFSFFSFFPYQLLTYNSVISTALLLFQIREQRLPHVRRSAFVPGRRARGRCRCLARVVCAVHVHLSGVEEESSCGVFFDYAHTHINKHIHKQTHTLTHHVKSLNITMEKIIKIQR